MRVVYVSNEREVATFHPAGGIPRKDEVAYIHFPGLPYGEWKVWRIEWDYNEDKLNCVFVHVYPLDHTNEEDDA